MKLYSDLTQANLEALRVAAETGEDAYVVHNAYDFTAGVGFVVFPGPWDEFLGTCDVVEEVTPDGQFSVECTPGRS